MPMNAMFNRFSSVECNSKPPQDVACPAPAYLYITDGSHIPICGHM